VGKYRRYARRKRGRRKLGKLLLPTSLVIALLYIVMTLTVAFSLQEGLVRYDLTGDRIVNVTLLRATYIAPPEDRNYTVLVTVSNETLRFTIPKGSEWKTFYLRESRLVKACGEVVNTSFRVAESPVNTSYPGPFINLTRIGRSEDYILTQYPLEIYFVLSAQLCNASVKAEYRGVDMGSIRVEYKEWEDGPVNVAEVNCREGSCLSRLTTGCVYSYRVSAEPTIAGILKLKFENGRLYMRLLDNPWITVVLYVVTVLPLWVYVKKRERAPTHPSRLLKGAKDVK
jgi:hypothetical protein